MTARDAKRKAWFELGVQAVRHVTEGRLEAYVCPLFESSFTDVGDLTFEHAPPRSLGGREVALTCRECNHGAGQSLDAEMRRFEDLLDWHLGTSRKPIRARLAVPGHDPVTVQTERREGGAFEFVGLPHQNNPMTTETHLAAMDAMAAGPVGEQALTVSFPWHQHVPANVEAGWLRAAYLATFAKLGYTYAFRRLFEPVRAQISDPAGSHVKRFYLGGLTTRPTCACSSCSPSHARCGQSP